MAGPDRKAALIGQTTLIGIDFVAVGTHQRALDVYFLNDPSTLSPALTIAPADVTITGEDDPSVPIQSTAWKKHPDGRTVLHVVTTRPGDFGRYWLSIAGDRIDPYFRQIEINFKAACPRDIDCAPPPHLCPADPPEQIVVDGSARDFWSLRTALLGFANQRNPRWQDRLEADVGVMIVELMASLGDELAYYQDRVARETHFTSASQRRSVRRHVRLVDYDLADGLGATGWVAITAGPNPPGFQNVPAGTDMWARSDGGRTVGFEIGNGLAEVIDGTTYRVHAGRNQIAAYIWEGDEPDPMASLRPLPATCLPVGATSVYVQGHVASLFTPGEHVFVVTTPPADQRDMPIRRLLVTLTAATDGVDPLFGSAPGSPVTLLAWQEPTPFEMNLEWLSVLGNAVPVTAGVTNTEVFSIGPNTQSTDEAVERVGANASTAFLYTLPDRDGEGLVRLGTDPHASAPEIALVELALPANVEGHAWTWRTSLVGSISAEPEDTVFTLDDGSWQRAVGYQRPTGLFVHYDYIAGVGSTIRFGDGEFGQMPARGSAQPGLDKFFRVRFRLGNGAQGNLPSDTLRWADSTGTLSFTDVGVPFIASVTNPLPTSGGVDPETLDQAKRDAPEAFRAVTYRAVTADDYDEIAERLDWVQRAGTQFRWTGSWLSAFTTADPLHADDLPIDQRIALTQYLDRFRMAGREVHVLAPVYADLQLRIKVCVEAGSYPSDVEQAVLLALIGRGGVQPIVGFFDPDNFTFGTPLDRSDLEAAVQRVPGVRAVEQIWIARPGWFKRRRFLEAQYVPGADEVIRVDNDPLHPDRGSVSIRTEGGA